MYSPETIAFFRHISEIIKEHRLREGITQKELANLCSVSQTTIYRAENNFESVKFGLATAILENINWEMSLNQAKKPETKLSNNDSLSKDLRLSESKNDMFFDVLRKNRRIWAYFNYDPQSCAKLLVELMKIQTDDQQN